MESAIKRRLSGEELTALVERAFQGQRRLDGYEELKDGWFNSAYALTLDNGMKTVLKLAPGSEEGMLRYERNVMTAEVEVLRLLAAADGIPVPGILYEERGVEGSEWFLMEFVPGDPYNKVKEQMGPEERRDIEVELGRVNRRINEIQGKRFGYYVREDSQGDSWPAVFTDMIGGVLADAADQAVALPMDAEEVFGLLRERQASLGEVTGSAAGPLGLVGWERIRQRPASYRHHRLRKGALGRSADGILLPLVCGKRGVPGRLRQAGFYGGGMRADGLVRPVHRVDSSYRMQVPPVHRRESYPLGGGAFSPYLERFK
ncbi:hypothetical protein HMSSN036_45760 [Paenibacillus macerans]|nr:hypothetical protein HMSSN036_45760 [Paenibacillus macerans]